MCVYYEVSNRLKLISFVICVCYFDNVPVVMMAFCFRVRLRQLPGASRKQSTSSNFSEPCTPNKKNPNKPKPAPSKNPNKPKPASSKNKKEKTFSFPYFPKQKYVPVFTFVWENTRFREELKSRCSDICVLTGTTQKLQISQKDHEVSSVRSLNKF